MPDSIQGKIDFFHAEADCSLFQHIDEKMTAELRDSGHHRPAGSLTQSNWQQATVIFGHEGLSIVGMIVVHVDIPFSKATFFRLWVLPSHRRFGVGRGLMMAAERLAVERGAAIIEFDTGSDLVAAVNLYRSLGYSETATSRPGGKGLLFRKPFV